MAKLYRVKDWDAHFENNRSRDQINTRWVPVPNKHDGEGYLTVMEQSDGLAMFGAWNLILQVASKCHPRGTLVRRDGTPLTAHAISRKTRCSDPDAIQRALDFCASPEVGWLEVVSDNPAGGCGEAAPKCIEGKGREGKEGKRKKAQEAAPEPVSLPKLSKPVEELASKLYGGVPVANLADAIELHTEAIVYRAMKVTEAADKRLWNYTAAILRNWAKNGVPPEDTTAAKAAGAQSEFTEAMRAEFRELRFDVRSRRVKRLQSKSGKIVEVGLYDPAGDYIAIIQNGEKLVLDLRTFKAAGYKRYTGKAPARHQPSEDKKAADARRQEIQAQKVSILKKGK